MNIIVWFLGAFMLLNPVTNETQSGVALFASEEACQLATIPLIAVAEENDWDVFTICVNTSISTEGENIQ